MSGRRKALIIANDEYEHDGLRRLLAPAADAVALGTVLGDHLIGDFAVHVVRNEPAHVIQAHIEEMFSECQSEDVLLLHFSGHGLKNESGDLFFAAPNTRPNRLGSTAVSADFVQRCMRTSRSRSIVLLLDCCYGGAFARGVTVRASGDINVLGSFPHERPGGGRGRAVITASSAMEYAFEGDQLADDEEPRPSVFTTALVEGLRTGDADRDQDGWVSLNELYDYVFDKVRERNPHQTPSRDVEMQGELFIARRSRPVTIPSRLPPELQQAVDHPLAGIRTGAVQELARVLRGGHAGLALGARLALEQLADDDSRAVSAAAAQVLGSEVPVAEAEVPVAEAAPPADPVLVRAEPVRAEPVPAEAARAEAARAEAVGSAPASAPKDWLMLTAGTLAILAALANIVALFPIFLSTFRLISLAAVTGQIVIGSAFVLGGGICVIVPRTRRLIGPGVLVGSVATAPGDLAFVLVLLGKTGSPGVGLWLVVTAEILFIVAACLTGVSLRKSGDLRVGARPPASAVAWLVALLGLAGAVAFLVQVQGAEFIPGLGTGAEPGELVAPLIWVTAMAAVVPAVAAVARQRRFGTALLAGWIGNGLAEVAFFTGFRTSLFGYSVFALAIALLPFARARPPASATSDDAGRDD